ncbi:MAG: GNAT family N-acetyltransferase [Symbiobacteriia bacterium]
MSLQLPLSFTAKDGGTVTIRLVTPADAPASVEVVRAVAAEDRYILVEPEQVRTPLQQREFLQRLHPEDDCFLVAEVDGWLVGQIDVYRGRWGKTRHTADLGIVILDRYRNLGIGRHLLAATEEWARDRELLKLSLGVISSNGRAIHLYKTCGFEVEGVRSRHLYIGGEYVDELIMGKFL